MLITPVLEVDGREKQVDTYYFNKRRAPGDVRLPLVSWGRSLRTTTTATASASPRAYRAVTSTTLAWHPTVVHDLHESQAYLYVSTGTRSVIAELDPIVLHEWWTLADNDVREMTRRGVPGVWTWAYYDGWMPNYMFFIAHTHNAIGRFYEVQELRSRSIHRASRFAEATSREWFRPLPPLRHQMGSAQHRQHSSSRPCCCPFSMSPTTATTYLDNYWLKNRRSVEQAGRVPRSPG